MRARDKIEAVIHALHRGEQNCFNCEYCAGPLSKGNHSYQLALGLCLLGMGVLAGSYKTFILSDDGWLQDAKSHCDEFYDGLSLDWGKFINEVVALVDGDDAPPSPPASSRSA